jgi:predicted nucleic acid-binding protein
MALFERLEPIPQRLKPQFDDNVKSELKLRPLLAPTLPRLRTSLAPLRRQNVTEEEAEEGAVYLQRFATTGAEIDGHFLGVREAFVLSRELGLTAYDCVYFELARRESLPLATLDRTLRAVAGKRGIPAL